MEMNANFDQRVVVKSTQLPWQASPIPGVDRRLLDRVGEEVARATSIVRYAAGSQFSAHTHTGGEEFLVLEGVFQDEHGDFPPGAYIRNPPGSQHTPGSDEGCVIFVKLWQFDSQDRTHVRLQSDFMQAIPHREYPGIAEIPLYKDGFETVSIQEWEPSATASMPLPGGAEVLILNGQWAEQEEPLEKFDWLRLPAGATLRATAGSTGARLWIKQGHLLQVERDRNNLARHQ